MVAVVEKVSASNYRRDMIVRGLLYIIVFWVETDAK